MEKKEGSGLKSKIPIFKKNEQKDRQTYRPPQPYIYSRLRANKREKWSWNSMCENDLNGYNNEMISTDC